MIMSCLLFQFGKSFQATAAAIEGSVNYHTIMITGMSTITAVACSAAYVPQGARWGQNVGICQRTPTINVWQLHNHRK